MAPQGEPASSKNPKRLLDVATFCFVVGAAIAASVAAWYTRQQWITAHDTLIIRERAFIYAAASNIITAVVPETNIGWIVIVDNAITNSGGTRTRDLEFIFRCTTSPNRLTEPWDLLHQETVEHLPQVIPPHDVVHVYCRFTRDEITGIRQNSLFGYVIGEITYHDVFDPNIRHITQVEKNLAVLAITDNPLNVAAYLASVGQHNCADEDCPRQ